MRPIPMNPWISPPRPRKKADLPRVLARVGLAELCAAAGISCRVSGGEQRPIACVVGREHFYSGRGYFVGVGGEWRATPMAALRLLEVLAYGFHDYAARECVCGRWLFSVPKRRGRPPNGARAQTARERMAAMRARRRAAS